MNRIIRISLVIPVYNVEKFLGRCIDSCIKQDINSDDYEIIIVNDGTQDGSLEIAEKYASSNKNIKVISQVNSGLSVARNTGLSKVSGKYVWFVDSDDWIANNCLSEIICKMETEALDMLQVGYYLAYDNGNLEESKRGQFDGCISGVEAMKKVYLPAPAQFTIYRTDFLRCFSLNFYPGIYHEDAEFKPRALFYAQRIAFLNKPVYYYYQRPTGSIMSKYSLKRGQDVLTVCENLIAFKDSCHMGSDVVKEFDYLIVVYLNQMFKGMQTLQGKEKKVLEDRFVGNKSLLNSFMNSKNFKHRIEGWILKQNFQLAQMIISKYF